MANPASDYHRGEMDIHEQVSTFHAFLGLSKWFCLALASVLVFVIMLFCTKAGFIPAAISGLVLLAIGIFALRGGKAASH